MPKLPGRGWNPARGEDDEAGDEDIGRILALSDGVFAIAVTLLILDIALPAATSAAALPRALLHLGPRYLAYALSFLVISRFWVIHRQAYRLIARADATLVWLNLLLLMGVAFLPFPTAVLGDHASVPAAAVLYAISVGLVSAASAATWWYASGRAKLLRPDVDRAQVRSLRVRSVAGPVFFAATVPVAAFVPFAAELMWAFGFPLVRAALGWYLARERQQPD